MLFSPIMSHPDDGSGCTSCDDAENPEGLFEYSWLGDTLTFTQTIGDVTKTVTLISGCCRIRADMGHDGGVDIADMVWLVDYMFYNAPPPVCMAEADVDGDGSELVDISDLVYLVDWMFTGGPPPPPCD